MLTNAPSVVIHDPNSTWPYGWDWNRVLDEVGGSIASHEIIAPDELTVVSDDEQDGRVVAVISGGTEGQTYAVTCRVTLDTSPAYIQDSTRFLRCRQR